jgi:sugar lactone lactonase YvrE
VFTRSGNILMGYGNSILNGTTGTLNPQAGLLRIDPRTGNHHLYVDGLAMANGVARMRDGTIFASDDGGIGVDRVGPDRTVENAWATVVSSNGMAVGRSGRWLYVNQTFQPAAIQRVRTNDPAQVEPYFTPGPADIAAGLDGMTRDRGDNLFVAANPIGELWRVQPDGNACVVADGLGMASAVAHGRSRHNFSRGNLYVVDFDGRLIEVPGGLKARP